LRVSVAGNAGRFIECAKLSKNFLPFVKNISERLAEAIKASGKSKGALAAHLGVPQSSVSRWLAGGEPRSERLTEIAKFLSVDVKWLLEGENAERYSNSKQPGIGDSAYVVREEPPDYRCEVDPVAAAFAKIREGLDLLEKFMKNPPP
jgi:transcriptional regulator with XRE-family HTH domain